MIDCNSAQGFGCPTLGELHFLMPVDRLSRHGNTEFIWLKNWDYIYYILYITLQNKMKREMLRHLRSFVIFKIGKFF